MSDSEDDNLPISQMVAKRKSKRKKPAPAKAKAAKLAPTAKPAASRRSRRLQPQVANDNDAENDILEKEEVTWFETKQGPAKKKQKTAVTKAAKTTDAFSPRKTRSMRKVASNATKEEQDKESLEENQKTDEMEIIDIHDDVQPVLQDVPATNEINTADEGPSVEEPEKKDSVVDLKQFQDVTKADDEDTPQDTVAEEPNEVADAVQARASLTKESKQNEANITEEVRVENSSTVNDEQGSSKGEMTQDANTATMKLSDAVLASNAMNDESLGSLTEAATRIEEEHSKKESASNMQEPNEGKVDASMDVDEQAKDSSPQKIDGANVGDKKPAKDKTLDEAEGGVESITKDYSVPHVVIGDSAESQLDHAAMNVPDVAGGDEELVEAGQKPPTNQATGGLPADKCDSDFVSRKKEVEMQVETQKQPSDLSDKDDARADAVTIKRPSPSKMLAEVNQESNQVMDMIKESALPAAKDDVVHNSLVVDESENLEETFALESQLHRHRKTALSISSPKEPLSPLDFLAEVADKGVFREGVKDVNEAGLYVPIESAKDGSGVPSPSVESAAVTIGGAIAVTAVEGSEISERSGVEAAKNGSKDIPSAQSKAESATGVSLNDDSKEISPANSQVPGHNGQTSTGMPKNPLLANSFEITTDSASGNVLEKRETGAASIQLVGPNLKDCGATEQNEIAERNSPPDSLDPASAATNLSPEKPPENAGATSSDHTKNTALPAKVEISPASAVLLAAAAQKKDLPVLGSETVDLMPVKMPPLMQQIVADASDLKGDGTRRERMETNNGSTPPGTHEAPPPAITANTCAVAASNNTSTSYVVERERTLVTAEHETSLYESSEGVIVVKKPVDVQQLTSQATGKGSREQVSLAEKDTGAVPMEIDDSVQSHQVHEMSPTPSPEDSGTNVDSDLGAATIQDSSLSTSTVQQSELSTDNGDKMEPRRTKEAKPTSAVASAVSIAALKAPTTEDTAALLDAFPDMAERKAFSSQPPNKRRGKNMSICISSAPSSSGIQEQSAGSAVQSSMPEPNPRRGLNSSIRDPQSSFGDMFSELEGENVFSKCDRELEESLAFFSETHEDQDPVFIELQHETKRHHLKEELVNIKTEYESGVSKINAVIASQIKERQVHTDKSIEKARHSYLLEEQRDLQRLQEAFVQKQKSNNEKISNGLNLVISRQSQEMQKAHLQHRQQAQQRGVSDQVASVEWGPLAQRLQAKQQQDLNEFKAKSEEVKRRLEAEYQREEEKYIAHHEKRRKDLEQTLEKAVARVRSTFQQQHQRYLKAFALRLKRKREELLRLLAKSNGEQLSGTTAAKGEEDSEAAVELCLPPPVTLNGSVSDSSGAALRSKHRKTIFSAVRKQLSVEIHNEGLWIMVVKEKGCDHNKKDADSAMPENCEFLSWGVKARSILQSIICGEIPVGYGTDRFDFGGDVVAANGGHIRCTVVDLRTSEETASAQRASGMKEQEADDVKVLEDKLEKLGIAVVEAEKHSIRAAAEEKEAIAGHEKALKDVEKTKDLIQQLRNKYKHMLGPDDVPLPTLNANDQSKLTNAFSKYNKNLEAMQARLKLAETALFEKKGRSQKMIVLVKQTTKAATAAATSLKKKKAQIDDAKSCRSRTRMSESMEAERASTRVADVIGALQKTAEGRREQLNQKRSSSASGTYVQSLPGLPNALKKSLWYKMHRRRHQIVLRPNLDFVLSDLKETMEATAFYSRERASRKHATKEEIALRAEQLFLLSAFPEQGSPLSSTPSTDSHAVWAEPGWQVNLDVPGKDSGASRLLLPRVHVSSLLQKNHSELSSAPGRQTASLIKTTHLQALNAPLSAASQAISLAETNPVSKDPTLSSGDPFNITEAAMTTGYNFGIKSPSRSPSSHSRRKPISKEGNAAPSAIVPLPSKVKAMIQPKPVDTSAPVLPIPAPPNRASSARYRKSSAMTTTKTDKPAKPKRSTSKSSVSASPRTKASKKKVDSTAAAASAAAADAASQARNFLQQQAALYGQQQRVSQVSLEQQAAQYSPSYMKQMAQSQTNLQALATPQLQQTMTAQQHQLLPQPPYGSPQQFQQRQLAQMRMIQQQQQGRPGFSQPQAGIQFFNPVAMQAYGSQQPPMPLPAQLQRGASTPMAAPPMAAPPMGAPPMAAPPMAAPPMAAPPMAALPMAAPPMAVPAGQQQRIGSNGNDNRNDPLFMLPDVPPPPSHQQSSG